MNSIVIERRLLHGGGQQVPRRIVVHCMAAEIDYKGKRYSAWDFLNLVDPPDKVGLSAHVLIAPDGTRTRCRADNEIAYHAKGYNTDSLGVEILVPHAYNLDQLQQRTRHNWVSTNQLDSLVQQIMIWKTAHRIEHINRHSDLDPARRWFDPGGGFPWLDLLWRTWADG